MAGKANERRNLRVWCAASARAEGPRGPVRGTCRNLSQGGMFFLGASLPLGKSFEFKVELPQGTVTTVGVVRYQYSYPEGGGVGVKFSRVSQDDLSKIIGFVEANRANEVRRS